MTRLVAVVGPTAAGKSALGVEIASAHGGEVINCDSRLFYRGFDIGTAKPSKDEMRGVPHHLIDILEPDETLGLRSFLDLATDTIREVASRRRLPVLVGGTGQYVWGLLEGWEVSRVAPDPRFRAELEEFAKVEGPEALAARLEEVDPEAAARIDPRNVRRVIRALEVARVRGAGAPSRWKKAKAPPFRAQILGVTLPRPELYRRIDERIDRMVEKGWLDEVRRLLESGVPEDAGAMRSIGYQAMARAARGELSLAEAVAIARHDTRRLVRHQYNWFRLSDRRIRWLEGDRPGAAAIEIVRDWLWAGEGNPE
ncbi:MAG: tRNA (adenosine(37)-N6)-dimethylallyltransferase MiaA [Chloroflexi bacterium]|nr:tRNA (adenosine(37)-N6)-dimethylallyltransferase MiaA [Chloroflexota bacterium]